MLSSMGPGSSYSQISKFFIKQTLLVWPSLGLQQEHLGLGKGCWATL